MDPQSGSNLRKSPRDPKNPSVSAKGEQNCLKCRKRRSSHQLCSITVSLVVANVKHFEKLNQQNMREEQMTEERRCSLEITVERR